MRDAELQSVSFSNPVNKPNLFLPPRYWLLLSR